MNVSSRTRIESILLVGSTTRASTNWVVEEAGLGTRSSPRVR
jgi:hypothetical protein